jgi:hypothetical protein
MDRYRFEGPQPVLTRCYVTKMDCVCVCTKLQHNKNYWLTFAYEQENGIFLFSKTSSSAVELTQRSKERVPK